MTLYVCLSVRVFVLILSLPQVLFDDGDKLEYVSRRSIISESKYRSFFGRDPPPLPEPNQEDEEDRSRTTAVLTPKEMYEQRCGGCEMCRKPDCGLCATCRANEGAPDHERQVCLQKVCCGDLSAILLHRSLSLVRCRSCRCVLVFLSSKRFNNVSR